MAEHTETESELLEWIEDLQEENERSSREIGSLRQQVAVAESVIPKYQEALSASQFELWKIQALLGIANQPTA